MIDVVRANLRRRWGRSALAGLGVAIGVATVVALLAVTGGLSRSAGDLARLGRADFGIFQGGLSDLTASSLPSSIVSRLDAVPGVATKSPIQIVAHAIAADSSMLVFGANQHGALGNRLVLISGRLPTGGGLLVGDRAARKLSVSVGDRLTVEGRPLPIAGVYRSGVSLEDAGVVLPLEVTQQLSGRRGEISMVAVTVATGYRETDVEQAVERAVPGIVAVGDPTEVARVDTNSRVINNAATVIAVLGLILGAVVVVNTMAMAVTARGREFGLLTLLGWSRGQIAELILADAIAVSLLGAVVGLGIGALASELVVRALAVATFVSPSISLWVLARGLIVGLALGLLGALFCLWRVMRVPALRAVGA